MSSQIPNIEHLIHTVLNDTDATARQQAAADLGKSKDERALELLVHALKDNDLEVRRVAALALAEVEDARAIEELITAFEENGCEEVYLALAIALAELGHIEYLEVALASDHGYMREHTTAALKQYTDGRAVNCLIKALSQDSYWAARALGAIGDQRAVEPLIESLNHPHSSNREVVVSALARLGDARAIEPLKRVCRDETGNLAKEAATAIRIIKLKQEAKVKANKQNAH